MKFFIKQHSTLPYLEIDLEYFSEKYDIKIEHWEKAVATFSMYDKNNRKFVIANNEAKIIAKEREIFIDNPYDYYVRYGFNTDETKFHGEFLGEFKIDFLGYHECGKITIPNTKKIDIVIIKSITKTDKSSFGEQTGNTSLIYPEWYFGTYEVLGGVVNIPLASDINLATGTLVDTINSNNDFIIPFNSTTTDFVWFAIPVLSTSKNKWYIDELSYGDIGGPKDKNGNLFPDPDTITYNGKNYKLYISNYRTDIVKIKVLNQ